MGISQDIPNNQPSPPVQNLSRKQSGIQDLNDSIKASQEKSEVDRSKLEDGSSDTIPKLEKHIPLLERESGGQNELGKFGGRKSQVDILSNFPK